MVQTDTGADLLAELVAADDESVAAGAVEAVGVDLHGGVAIKEGVVQDQYILRVVVRIEVELVAVHKDAIEVGGTRGVRASAEHALLDDETFDSVDEVDGTRIVEVQRKEVELLEQHVVRTIQLEDVVVQ